MKPRFVRTGLAAALLGAWIGCSADESANPQRISPERCAEQHGKYVAGRYCVFAHAADGGSDGAADNDGEVLGDGGNPDSEIPGKDSGAPEPCKNAGASELCYSADLRTASQLPCKAGTRTCQDGFWGECVGDVTPKNETCNGEDDDCDGSNDEGLTMQRCSLADSNVKGVCRDGFQFCRDGSIVCIQVNFPGTDSCNGRDDDCDGNVDEHTELKCYSGSSGCSASSGSTEYTCQGECQPGIKQCVGDKYSTQCTGSVTPAAEQCTTSGDQVKDENCDGVEDEDCSCQNGATFSCYTGSPPSSQGMGPCRAGTRTCAGGALGGCTGEVTPQTETCGNEGVDDDCNGTLDDVAMRNTSCADMSGGQGECKAQARWQCDNGSLVCKDAAPASEICDGKDQDCDGTADEGFNKETDSSNCGTCGTSCGTGRCCAGSCVNLQNSNNNCGACGTVCPANNGCCGGACKNLVNDSSNCGACGNACAVLTHCSNRNCVLL